MSVNRVTTTGPNGLIQQLDQYMNAHQQVQPISMANQMQYSGLNWQAPQPPQAIKRFTSKEVPAYHVFDVTDTWVKVFHMVHWITTQTKGEYVLSFDTHEVVRLQSSEVDRITDLKVQFYEMNDAVMFKTTFG